MRIPHTVPRNVFEAYRCSSETSRLPNERDRRIRAEDVSWDENIIPDLKILALRAIISAWEDNPVLEELPTCADRNVLLETLPTGLPFELVITRIADEHYWERSAKDRWERNDPREHGDSWRRLYCERHVCEYLEKLEASYFESQKEECEKVIKLVRDYVHAIRLRSLQPTKKPTKWSNIDNDDPCSTDDDVVHHIPMAIILPQFPHLTEIYINFGVIYMDDGFEWRDFVFSVEDCLDLGKGIKACTKLKKFALTRSNLDQPRVAAILQGMVENDSIEELDFSHCKLSDTGAYAVGEFLSMHRNLKVLNLMNNNIGDSGLGGVVYGLLKKGTATLKSLNLRLNPLGNIGATHICAFLMRNETLEVLNISGCELTAEAGEALADVLSSGFIKIPSLHLDLSNNDFGPTVGEAFEVAMKSSPYILDLDVRMCNFSKESEYSIHESAVSNKDNQKKEKRKMMYGHGKSEHVLSSVYSVHQPTKLATNSIPGRQKNCSNRSTGTQINNDTGVMKSILKFPKPTFASKQDMKLSHPSHAKFKAPFGSDAETQGD